MPLGLDEHLDQLGEAIREEVNDDAGHTLPCQLNRPIRFRILSIGCSTSSAESVPARSVKAKARRPLPQKLRGRPDVKC